MNCLIQSRDHTYIGAFGDYQYAKFRRNADNTMAKRKGTQ
jgi:hypothetical protein